jgi:hypothetical protein
MRAACLAYIIKGLHVSVPVAAFVYIQCLITKLRLLKDFWRYSRTKNYEQTAIVGMAAGASNKLCGGVV